MSLTSKMYVEGVLQTVLDTAPIYEDATYSYYGEAKVGRALNEPYWRVSRINKTTSQEQYAGTGAFEHLFTDLATVQALFT